MSAGSGAGRLPPTPSQTIGPFFSFGLEWLAGRRAPAGGDGLGLEGVVYDGNGAPVPDAMIEVYGAGPGGSYGPGTAGFARCLTDDHGRYRFDLVKPGAVDARQAPHLEVSLFARGLLQRLYTRVYFPDEGDANGRDPVLSAIADEGRRRTLVAVAQGSRLCFDIHLQGPGETAFLEW